MPDRIDLVRLGMNQAVDYARGALSRHFDRCLCRPTRVQFNVRRGCNLRCEHCIFYLEAQPTDALRIDEWEKLADDIGAWLGPFNLSICGLGEPLLLGANIARIVARATSHGARVQLSTNGTPLTQHLTRTLVEAGLASLTVSLDGATAGTHDRIRGRAGTFDQVVRNLRAANAMRGSMILSIQAVIMEQNLGELEDLARWVANEEFSKFNLQPLQATMGVPFDPGWRQHSSLWPRDSARVEAVLNRLRSLRDRGYPIDVSDFEFDLWVRYYREPTVAAEHCAVGYNNFNVSETGVVTVCSEIREIGNVRQNSPREIWKSHQATEARQDVAGCHRSCSLLNCNVEKPLMHRAGRLLTELLHPGH